MPKIPKNPDNNLISDDVTLLSPDQWQKILYSLQKIANKQKPDKKFTYWTCSICGVNNADDDLICAGCGLDLG